MKTVQDYSYGQEQKPRRGNPNYGIAKPYSEVREIIKPFKFKYVVEYRAWAEEMKRQGTGDGFPLNPHAVYLRRGEWVSREHFLGITDDITVESDIQSKEPVKEQISFSKIRTIISQILGLKRERLTV